MKIKIQSIQLSLFLLVFVNCATMFSESRYNYSFSSTPSSAKVSIYNSDFAEDKCNTPCSIFISMKKETVLKIEANGYKEKFITLERSINGWLWANLVLGGAVGILIDHFSGAMYKPFDNRTNIDIILEPKESEQSKESKPKKT